MDVNCSQELIYTPLGNRKKRFRIVKSSPSVAQGGNPRVKHLPWCLKPPKSSKIKLFLCCRACNTSYYCALPPRKRNNFALALVASILV